MATLMTNYVGKKGLKIDICPLLLANTYVSNGLKNFLEPANIKWLNQLLTLTTNNHINLAKVHDS